MTEARRHTVRARGAVTAAGAIVLPVTLMAAAACGAPDRTRVSRVDPAYDASSGRLVQLRYDSNDDGRPDTVSFMDGARMLRTEIDVDRDGLVDRWEYHDAAGQLVRVGFSRVGDGKEDAWSFAGPDKTVSRVELSTARDGTVDRTEHYGATGLASAEEDTDRDGSVDKWETYDHGRLVSVAFDTSHRGTPDRRLVYDAAGMARVETIADARRP